MADLNFKRNFSLKIDNAVSTDRKNVVGHTHMNFPTQGHII